MNKNELNAFRKTNIGVHSGEHFEITNPFEDLKGLSPSAHCFVILLIGTEVTAIQGRMVY